MDLALALRSIMAGLFAALAVISVGWLIHSCYRWAMGRS